MASTSTSTKYYIYGPKRPINFTLNNSYGVELEIVRSPVRLAAVALYHAMLQLSRVHIVVLLLSTSACRPTLVLQYRPYTRSL